MAVGVVHCHAAKSPNCEVDGELLATRSGPRNRPVLDGGMAGFIRVRRSNAPDADSDQLILGDDVAIACFGVAAIGCDLAKGPNPIVLGTELGVCKFQPVGFPLLRQFASAVDID